MKIIIPEPCHEDWDKMTPVDKGSFCSSCAKIVVDFTKMKDQEVIHYFETHTQQTTCGRFLNSQIDTKTSLAEPKNIHFTFPELQKVKSYVHRFIVALVIVFGNTLFIGCGQTLGKIESPYTTGGIVEMEDTTLLKTDTAEVNTKPLEKTLHPMEMLGDVSCEVDTIKKDTLNSLTIKPTVKGVSFKHGKPKLIPELVEVISMGEPMLIPTIDSNSIQGDTILQELFLKDTTKKKGTK